MLYEGHTPDELGKRLGTADCIVLSTITSTLDLIHKLAAAGAPEHTLVVADEQISGRGTRGRSWHSPAASGIWLGYLFRSKTTASGVLSLRVGLALSTSLSDLGIATRLKWPNDLMIGDRKAGGILCEARTVGESGWIAIGVGVNVYGPVSGDLELVATSLDAVSVNVNRVAVLERFVPLLRDLKEAPELTSDEIVQFSQRDWLRGRKISSPVAGVAAGISVDGALNVDTGSGIKRVLGGTVALV